MTLRVTDQGFSPAPLQVATPLLTATSEDQVLLLANSDDPALAVPFFTHVTEIQITFPSFSDGRGFTLARLLRNLGYAWRLIAKGSGRKSEEYDKPLDAQIARMGASDRAKAQQAADGFTEGARVGDTVSAAGRP